MTIRFVKYWNGYSPDAIVYNLGSTEEARLVSLGYATTDLDGPGTPEGELARITTTPSGGVAMLSASGSTLAEWDAAENLLANVNLRTDTLANLLALASGGGVSEIGYDPATHTLVMFNGVAGQAAASGRNRVIASAAAKITNVATSATPTTYTPVPWNTAAVLYDDSILVPAAPEKLVVPTGAGAVRIRGNFTFTAGAGLTRQFRLEASVDGGTVFNNIGPIGVIPSDGTNVAYGYIDLIAPISGVTHVRLAAANAGSISLTCGTHPNSYAEVEFLAV